MKSEHIIDAAHEKDTKKETSNEVVPRKFVACMALNVQLGMCDWLCTDGNV